MKYRILLVEDDPNLGVVLEEYLRLKGYEVTLAQDGEAGWNSFIDRAADLCILDVMMPKKDGFTLAKEIRARNAVVPIIFLTAKALKEDRIEGFELGADDYITKPFAAEELLLRIQAIIRRCESNVSLKKKDDYVFSEFKFFYPLRTLSRGDTKHTLTSKEADLLRMLLEYKNETLRRDVALREIWGDDSYFNGRSMDVFLTKLRKYLRDDPNIEIVNVHGTGYKMVVTNESVLA